MKKFQLILDKETFLPGEDLAGKLIINPKKETKLRSIFIEITGTEETDIPRSDGDSTKHYKESRSLIHRMINTRDFFKLSELEMISDVSRKDQYKLVPGMYEIPFSVPLPSDLLPSYSGKCAWVKYSVSAHMDIPWWPDWFDTKALLISQPVPAEVPAKRIEQHHEFQKSIWQVFSPQMKVSVELESATVARGGKLAGQLIIDNKSGKLARGINLEIVATEFAQAEKEKEETPRYSFSKKLRISQPSKEYVLQHFELDIPKDVTPTNMGRWFSYNWMLNINLDIKAAVDKKTRTPIVIL